jgi:hypothetical protein
MVNGLQPVSVRQLRVMGRNFVVSLAVVFSRSFVAISRLPAVLSRLQMVFVDFQGHSSNPGF